MSSPQVLSMPGVDFGTVRAQVHQFVWRPGVQVLEIGSPQRVAPYSLAIEAEVTAHDRQLSSGRLILLHDPAGNDAWEGQYRCVSLVQADVDIAMAADPLLIDVGWTWLTESLERSGGAYAAESGTVTTINGRGFGGLADQPDRAEIEIRCSWTPVFDGALDLYPHLEAWQDLLCLAAGLPLGGSAALGCMR